MILEGLSDRIMCKQVAKCLEDASRGDIPVKMAPGRKALRRDTAQPRLQERAAVQSGWSGRTESWGASGQVGTLREESISSEATGNDFSHDHLIVVLRR